MTDDWNEEEWKLFCKGWTSTSKGYYDPNKVRRLSDGISDWKAWARPIHKDMNFDTITVKHQNYTEAWRSSATYKASYEAIERTVLTRNHLEVALCMCLGLGSFTGVCHKDTGTRSRHRAFSQLVAFEGWVEQLSIRRSSLCNFPWLTIYLQELDLISNTSISKTPDSLF